MMHTPAIRLSATLMGFALSAMVFADPPAVAPSASDSAVQQGLELARKHEFGKAIELWQPQADHGNAAAQTYLGTLYATGQGIAKDDAQAVVWFRKAAEQGYPKAQYNLGIGYANGLGIEKDEAQAVVWFRKAAEQGDAEAQFSLGVMYTKGQGVQRNYGQAVYWYALAAQKRNEAAERNLEIVVDTLANLRMRSTTNVLARPEANAPVVKSTTAGEIAYRISQFGTWYEVYFRDHNTVGYIPVSQAATVVADARATVEPPTRPAASNFPPMPAARPGVTSCSTRCNNGECLRTYDDGRHVEFQARHNFNPSTNEWEWDAGSC